MAIIDRIKFDGDRNERQWLIYKYPSEQFVLGSHLIVNQGQEALFIKGGKALDLFGPGTYVLATENLPILNKLVNLPFGGKTPFTAEIYYINKTVNLNLKWGTSTPIPVEDPKYKNLLYIRARGQYGICINNSRLFIAKIIGAVPNGKVADQTLIIRNFNSLINTKIKSVISEYMVKKKISFVEISGYLSELSSVFKEKLEDQFDRFGIEIVNFSCEAIEPGQKDCRALRKKMEENIKLNESEPQIICPECGMKNGRTAKFCSECGKRIVLNTVCSSCGFENMPGMKYCGNCGKQLLS